jgi:arylsulfatase A-like enzyme
VLVADQEEQSAEVRSTERPIEMDLYDEVPVPSLAERMGWGMRLGAAGGLLLAAVELLVHAFGLSLPMGALGWLSMAAWIVAVDLLFGVLAAGATGLLVHLPDRHRLEVGDPPSKVGTQVGLVAFLATLITLGERIVRLAIEGQVVGTIVLGLVPFIIATGVGVFARIVCRRWWYGHAWDLLPWGVALVVLATLTGLFVPHSAPAGRPPHDGPSVLLVSVDGWRADRPIEALTQVAAGGVEFRQAVTPTGSSRGANTSLLTGLHPLRHHVLRESSHLSRGYTTLFEVLQEKGYVTGAFVSSSAVESGTGLDQGFDTFDDAFSVLRRSAVARVGLAAVASVLDPHYVGWPYARSSEETARAFARWAGQQQGPFAAWVHLAQPIRAEHGVEEPALQADTLLGALPPGAVVVLVGTHGVLAGEHGGTGHRTLFDAVVHVPLFVRAPGHPVKAPVVEPQVRLVDVASTVLDAAGFDEMPQSEGVSLVAYGTGFRQASLSATMVGQDIDGSWLVGVRNNGVKVIVWPDGKDALFLLDEDPGETRDRREDEASALGQARALLAADRTALAELVSRAFRR